MKKSLNEYKAVIKTPISTDAYANPDPTILAWPIASINASLEKNPEKPGKPMSAREPINDVKYVMGSLLLSPPIFLMSCS